MAGKTLIGVIGTILIILGGIWTIAIGISKPIYITGLFITAFMVILGIILIALAIKE
jgi:hypothetical protein